VLLPPIEYAYLQARHNADPPPNLAGELFAEQGPEHSGTLRLAWPETLDAPSEKRARHLWIIVFPMLCIAITVGVKCLPGTR
jgi:hypothetical protein